MATDIPKWPENELRTPPRPPPLKQWPERKDARTAKGHLPEPSFYHLVTATRPDPARCQKDGREKNFGRNESGSDDSTPGSFEQSDDIAGTAAGVPKKRLRPGPVPKLEHMGLQSFQEGGYFDMQIEEATAKLGVGRTVLTRRVRQLGISRWLYRRRASMRKLIAKTHCYLVGLMFMCCISVLTIRLCNTPEEL
ncbi:hypothetical protein WJX75_000270 [Coccomyxa subellipsoidea]|uniref:RWP-RK domain-containing protein n=1 Tax=Coccomyxa subellipsoidea TaxID=248742 RepID=A0ABR2YCN9_9CHLO